MFKASLTAAVMATMPVASHAGDIWGTMTLTMDGEEQTRYITADNGVSQSHFSTVMPGSLTGANFNLTGLPEKDKLSGYQDIFSLRATLARTPRGTIAVEPTMEYLVNAYTDFWRNADSMEVELTEVVIGEDATHIAGSFSGTMFHALNPEGSDFDRAQAKAVSGTFDVAFPSN